MSERNELPAADHDDCAPLSDAEKNVPHGAEWRHQQAAMRHDPEAIRKLFMEHLNPRGARVVALEKPSEQERDRTACMMHFLASLDYPNKDTTVVRAPDPLIVGHSQHSIGRANHILGPSLSQW